MPGPPSHGADARRPLAVVTGASSGIGRALADQLAAHGHDLAISGSSDRVHDTARRLREDHDVEAFGYRGEAGTFAGVEDFWRFVESLQRPVAVAVLNVGIASGGTVADTELATHLQVLAINVVGTTHMAKRAIDHMVAHHSGRILVVSSMSASTPTPSAGGYGATKAFGFSLAQTIREELRDEGISVTVLLPGATDSDFHANAGMGGRTPIGREEKLAPDEVARLGYDALMAGRDMVIGGGPDVRREYEANRTTPEPEKAAAHAERTRPDA